MALYEMLNSWIDMNYDIAAVSNHIHMQIIYIPNDATVIVQENSGRENLDQSRSSRIIKSSNTPRSVSPGASRFPRVGGGRSNTCAAPPHPVRLALPFSIDYLLAIVIINRIYGWCFYCWIGVRGRGCCWVMRDESWGRRREPSEWRKC